LVALGKFLKKIKSKTLQHKYCLIALIIVFISAIILIDIASTLIEPLSFPTDNIADIISYRSIVSKDTGDHRLFSSVGFTEAPINSKQTIKAKLESLTEVNVDWTLEMYLVEKNVVFVYDTYKFLRYDQVINLEVSYNDIPVEYGITELDGEKYYTLYDLNITEVGRITQIGIHFTIERNAINSKLNRIPILFNENYAKIIRLPMTVVPVQLGHESDSNLLRVDLGLPFRRILLENSGWIDSFVPPKDEWGQYLVEPNNYRFPVFDYPIEQEFKQEENTYVFNTIFSENNIAYSASLVLVPDYSILITLVIFLLSPIFIPFLTWFTEKKIIDEPPFKRYLAVMLESYGLLSIAPFLISFFGGEFNLSLLFYILAITNPLSLAFVVCSPAVFGLFYNLWKERNKNTGSVRKKSERRQSKKKNKKR
jgi:hypothetical protein